MAPEIGCKVATKLPTHAPVEVYHLCFEASYSSSSILHPKTVMKKNESAIKYIIFMAWVYKQKRLQNSNDIPTIWVKEPRRI